MAVQTPLFEAPAQANWVADIYLNVRPPAFWLLRLLHLGTPVEVVWAPSQEPLRGALDWLARNLPPDAKPIALRGAFDEKQARTASNRLKNAQPLVLTAQNLGETSALAQRAQRYLTAECQTHYTPPNLPEMERPALLAAALKNAGVEEDDLFDEREQETLMLEYVLEHFLKKRNVELGLGSEPLRLLAAIRIQAEHVAAVYPYLSRLAAEYYYNAWNAVLPELPWPSLVTPDTQRRPSWDLKCP